MKKYLHLIILLLIVTNSSAIADCTANYVCSIKEMNKNTNSVIEEKQLNTAIQKEKEKFSQEKKSKVNPAKEKTEKKELNK